MFDSAPNPELEAVEDGLAAWLAYPVRSKAP